MAGEPSGVSEGNGVPFPGACVAVAQSGQSEGCLRTTETDWAPIQWAPASLELLSRPVFSRNSCLTMLGLSSPPECEPNCFHKHLCGWLPPDWLLLLSCLLKNQSCHLYSHHPSRPSQCTEGHPGGALTMRLTRMERLAERPPLPLLPSTPCGL